MKIMRMLAVIVAVSALALGGSTATATWYNYNWDGDGGANNDFAWDIANPATWGNWDGDIEQATHAVNPGDTRAGFTMTGGTDVDPVTSEISTLWDYGPTESYMNVQPWHTVTLKDGGTLQLNGNCPYFRVQDGNATFKMEGGTFIGQITMDSPGGSTLEFSGGSFIATDMGRHYIRNADVVRVVGGLATLEPARIGLAKNGTGSRFEFVLNDTGISTLALKNDVFVQTSGSSSVNVEVTGIQDYLDGGGSYGTLDLITVVNASTALTELPTGSVDGGKGVTRLLADNTGYVLDVLNKAATWQGGAGNWEGSNWDIGGTANQSLGVFHPITVDTAGSDVAVTADSSGAAYTLSIGENNSSAVTVNATRTLTVANSVTVGGSGTLIVNGALDAPSMTTSGATTLNGGDIGDVAVSGGVFQMGAAPAVERLAVSAGTIQSAGFNNNVDELTVSGTGELSVSGDINTSGNIALNGGKLTATGAVTVNPGGSMIVGNKPALSVTSGASLTIPTGPGALPADTLGYWTFDNDTGVAVADSSGNGHDGAWASGGTVAPTYSTDTPAQLGGQSIDLTAGGQSIGFSTGGTEDVFDVGQHTISFWTKGVPSGDWSNWQGKAEPAGWMIRQHGANHNTLYWDIRNGGGDLAVDVSNFGDGEWHHMVFTWDGSEKKIYMDGELKATGGGQDPEPSPRAMSLGSLDASDDEGYQHAGGNSEIRTQMDDFAIIGRGISADEVAQLYAGLFTNFGDLTMDAGTNLNLSLAGVSGDGVASFEAVTVGDGATVNGSVTVNGIVSVGGSVGTLNVDGNLTMADDSILEWEIGAAGTDLIAVTGAGELTLDDFVLEILDLGDGASIAPGTDIPVFTYEAGTTVDLSGFGDQFYTDALGVNGDAWTWSNLALTDDGNGAIVLSGLSGGSVSTGLSWDGGVGNWADAMWGGATPTANQDMVIDAASADSVVTVAADFISGGTGPAGSVAVGATNAATLVVASGNTLEVTGETAAGASGKIAVENGATLQTDSATIEAGGRLISGVQGSNNGLLDSTGQLSIGDADAIQVDWMPGSDAGSMFGGTYTVASYTGTALATTGTTANADGNIGPGYIKSVDYAADLGGGVLGVNVELHAQGLGDTDLDADVDGDDLATFGLSWAPSGTDKTWSDGDFDFDGDIDGDDLAALGLAWAPSGIDFPAGDLEVTAVPEPGTIVMLLIGMAGLLIYRKRR